MQQWNLKMREGNDVWDETRNGDGAALGLTPADNLAVALRADVVAERKADLAATAAMAWLITEGLNCVDERGRALFHFGF